MFLMILICFGLFGTLFMLVNLWFPITLVPFVQMGLQTTGTILLWMGIIVYLMRVYSTGANAWIMLPNPLKTNCIHQGKSGAKIIRGSKQEPNRIRARGKGYRNSGKWMNIKDTGEALNVAGHDTVITAQDVGHNFPLWVIDYIDTIKRNFKVKDEKEFFDLHDKIKEVKSHEEFFKIPELQPLFEDTEKKHYFEQMELDDIKEMKCLIYDGRVINYKQYLDWSEGATPYDNESIIDSDVSHRLSQMSNFLKGGSGDMMKYVIIMFIIVIIGIIAYQGFGG